MPVPITPECPTLSPTQAPGSGRLRFAHVAGRTVLTRASAWAYLATYGGGLVGGDQVRMRIEVGPQAAALVSTQASTKVYRSARRASQEPMPGPLLATWTRAIAVNA